MKIPNNIEREHLIKAIEKIDAEGLPADGSSQYYDVLHNNRRYPPKVVVSFANFFVNGELLDRRSFEGGRGTACFNLLEEKGFEIVMKQSRVTDKIKSFTEHYAVEVDQRHSNTLDSFKLLVKEIPEDIRHILKPLSNEVKIKGSIGAGVNTYYPWLGIFDPRVSSGATNGFYVVILFSDDFKNLYLTLNQGSTIQSKEQTEAYKKFINSIYQNIDGFIKGRIPEGGLVKTQKGKAALNGRKYEETNIFYRKYEVASIEEEDFLNNLDKIVKCYILCADNYQQSLNPNSVNVAIATNSSFNYLKFSKDIKTANFQINEAIIVRFISSLLTKPFVILTGLSGSGKTKLAQAFANWICNSNNQYKIVPVGADWTNREPLLGYPNALKSGEYVKPDNGVVDLIIKANADAENPYFLILDEMNLSHVERYFADFLSIMESKGKCSLHPGPEDWKDVPASISLPENLFIIGTVNIDETTYMFSPKVLDRANVIEFRVDVEEMRNFLNQQNRLDLESLLFAGSNMGKAFVQLAKDKSLEANNIIDLQSALILFFTELKKTGAEFGYRSASEILRFAAIINTIEPNWKISEIIDAAIMQKLLPKVHGSRRKLEPILKTLGQLCLMTGEKFETFLSPQIEIDFNDSEKFLYPISFEKILRMYKGLLDNGFTSYAEA